MRRQIGRFGGFRDERRAVRRGHFDQSSGSVPLHEGGSAAYDRGRRWRDSECDVRSDGSVVSVMSDELFDAVISINLRGVFLCTRAVAPHMIAGGGGAILNATSDRTVRLFP